MLTDRSMIMTKTHSVIAQKLCRFLLESADFQSKCINLFTASNRKVHDKKKFSKGNM